ncbi:agamous-like MADS-box protein AGL80 [Salvia divinorum]|uniref:Agamous-like MADS-box protein AGL80 n=1 Tax=Salvia divinorum TaxID=28513 RepID=A0ABD1HZY9_SALDI
MTRKKVTLAYIANDSERKASYRKRKKGLLKKVSELSTLCGIDACAIVCSQYDAAPEVWPSPLGAQAVLSRFRKLSDMDQSRKMDNQETFTRNRIKKTEEQLRRLRKENNCRELEAFMFRCIAGEASIDEFNMPDPAEMNFVINQTLGDINARMAAMEADRRRRQAAPLPLLVAPAPAEEDVAPRTEEESMEGFPWNLVQSPGGGGEAVDGGGLGWDDGMVLPYPYIFNHSSM